MKILQGRGIPKWTCQREVALAYWSESTGACESAGDHHLDEVRVLMELWPLRWALSDLGDCSSSLWTLVSQNSENSGRRHTPWKLDVLTCWPSAWKSVFAYEHHQGKYNLSPQPALPELLVQWWLVVWFTVQFALFKLESSYINTPQRNFIVCLILPLLFETVFFLKQTLESRLCQVDPWVWGRSFSKLYTHSRHVPCSWSDIKTVGLWLVWETLKVSPFEVQTLICY